MFGFRPDCFLLETSRLVLRPMIETDASLVVQWRNSVHNSSMSLFSPGKTISIEQHLEWFKKTRSQRIDCIIETKEGSLPIGSLSYVWHQLQDLGSCGEIGKCIGELSAMGKGYASEALACWIGFGFNQIGLDTVVSRTRKENSVNIRVNQKLGLSIESWPKYFQFISEDWVFMVLRRNDWIKRL